MFRDYLRYLYKQYSQSPKDFLIKTGVVFVLSTVAGVLVDVFLPFGSWWMILRSLILLPLAVSMFSLGYMLSLFLHDRQIEETAGEWVRYRMRYSVKWRRRLAVIAAAFLAVLMLAFGHSPVYTFMSSMIAATAIALFAFIRTTHAEKVREELEVPDARDVQIEAMMSPNLRVRRKKDEKKNTKDKKNV